jgi:hypothetical protein
VAVNVERRCRDGFAHIVTCGVAGQPLTSVEEEARAGAQAARAGLEEERAEWKEARAASEEAPRGGSEPLRVETVAARFAKALVRKLADGRPR